MDPAFIDKETLGEIPGLRKYRNMIWQNDS
jgi:hypothetical protein